MVYGSASSSKNLKKFSGVISIATELRSEGLQRREPRVFFGGCLKRASAIQVLLIIAGFFSFQRVSSRRRNFFHQMIGVALVSVHMGSVRTSKMVSAGWPVSRSATESGPVAISLRGGYHFRRATRDVPCLRQAAGHDTAYRPGRTDLPISTPGVGRRKWTGGRI